MMKHSNLIDKCIKDQSGNITIFQQPNTLIIVWLVTSILEKFVSGNAEKLLSLVSFGALFAWAWLEIFDGVNYFRRALGLVILILTLYGRLQH